MLFYRFRGTIIHFAGACGAYFQNVEITKCRGARAREVQVRVFYGGVTGRNFARAGRSEFYGIISAGKREARSARKFDRQITVLKSRDFKLTRAACGNLGQLGHNDLQTDAAVETKYAKPKQSASVHDERSVVASHPDVIEIVRPARRGNFVLVPARNFHGKSIPGPNFPKILHVVLSRFGLLKPVVTVRTRHLRRHASSH